jgi:hypothetical protein
MAIRFDSKTLALSDPFEVKYAPGSDVTLKPGDSWGLRGPGMVFSSQEAISLANGVASVSRYRKALRRAVAERPDSNSPELLRAVSAEGGTVASSVGQLEATCLNG